MESSCRAGLVKANKHVQRNKTTKHILFCSARYPSCVSNSEVMRQGSAKSLTARLNIIICIPLLYKLQDMLCKFPFQGLMASLAGTSCNSCRLQFCRTNLSQHYNVSLCLISETVVIHLCFVAILAFPFDSCGRRATCTTVKPVHTLSTSRKRFTWKS